MMVLGKKFELLYLVEFRFNEVNILLFWELVIRRDIVVTLSYSKYEKKKE